jgi:3-(3-hydroxy-phenyl)propionate hydroxylase
VLLNFGEPGGLGSVVRTDRVRLIDAQLVDSRGVGTLELPVIGEVAAPAGVLIRPDGHVAWAGEPAAPELPEALSTWFGAAASAT